MVASFKESVELKDGLRHIFMTVSSRKIVPDMGSISVLLTSEAVSLPTELLRLA